MSALNTEPIRAAYPADGTVAALCDEVERLREQLADHDASFDLAWSSNQRAIKMWQSETGETLTWPSNDRLCVWLMRQNDELRSALAAATAERDDLQRKLDRICASPRKVVES